VVVSKELLWLRDRDSSGIKRQRDREGGENVCHWKQLLEDIDEDIAD
jgi:hypothetical protein